MTENERATRVLEQKVAELEKWRPQLEDRIKKRSEAVDKKFEHSHDLLEAHKGNVKDQFMICSINHNRARDNHDEVK